MKKNIKTFIRQCSNIILAFSMLLFGFSCDDLIDIDPPTTQIVSETVFINSETANAALVGIYSEMLSPDDIFSGGRASVGVLTGLSSDEFINLSTSPERIYFFNNALISTSTTVQNSLWGKGFRIIYYANSVLEGLGASSAVDENTKKQLEGEAKFIRAFTNFYLLNLFGEIPLITSTAYQVNRFASRSKTEVVYNQIIADLQAAIELLPNDYSFAGGERTRPNRFAAMAMLSRVYLFNEDWSSAETYSSLVISNTENYVLLQNLDEVFLKNSKESIWQLANINDRNTWEGETYVPVQNSINSVVLRPELINTFEPADKRLARWIGSFVSGGNTNYFAFKYKNKLSAIPVTEYSTVLRVSEQYLIRSEARAQQGKILDGIADIDKIRERAGLPLIQVTNPSMDKTNLLAAIAQERQREFFAEWGHRWFDLKRTDKLTGTLQPLKSDWQPTDALYPIPQSEITVNPNLKQNDGY